MRKEPFPDPERLNGFSMVLVLARLKNRSQWYPLAALKKENNKGRTGVPQSLRDTFSLENVEKPSKELRRVRPE